MDMMSEEEYVEGSTEHCPVYAYEYELPKDLWMYFIQEKG